MKTDKRSFYIWIVVLFANIGVALSIMLLNIFHDNSLFETWNLIPIGVVLLVTIVPVFISRSNNRLKNHFGYGIPILLLLPVLYFIYDYFTCTGKFCEITPFFLGWIFGLSAIIFALFYAMGIYARKWPIRFVLSIIWIEIILFVGLVLYFGLK